MESSIIRALEDSGFVRHDGFNENYILTQKLLGKGNYGSVHEAYRRIPETDGKWERVAVKTLTFLQDNNKADCPKRNNNDDVMTAKLQCANELAKEVCLYKQAQGTGVTTMYEPWFDSCSGNVYIAMERMDCPLDTYAKKVMRMKFPQGVLTSIFVQCLGALRTVHRSSVVHRDVKPENFLVRYKRSCQHQKLNFPYSNVEVKLSDFGLSSEMTDTWTLSSNAGTPLFMPPESFISTKSEVPAARDVWGLACVFHILLTGERPFNGSTLEELKREVTHGKKKIRPLQDTRETRALAKVTLHMLHMHPKSRPTAEEALKELLNQRFSMLSDHLSLSQQGNTATNNHNYYNNSNPETNQNNYSTRKGSNSRARDDIFQEIKDLCVWELEPGAFPREDPLQSMYVCRPNYPVHIYVNPNPAHKLDVLHFGCFLLIDTSQGPVNFQPPTPPTAAALTATDLGASSSVVVLHGKSTTSSQQRLRKQQSSFGPLGVESNSIVTEGGGGNHVTPTPSGTTSSLFSDEENEGEDTVYGTHSANASLTSTNTRTYTNNNNNNYNNNTYSSCSPSPERRRPAAKPTRTTARKKTSSGIANYDDLLENNTLPWVRVVYPCEGYSQPRTIAGHCLHKHTASLSGNNNNNNTQKQKHYDPNHSSLTSPTNNNVTNPSSSTTSSASPKYNSLPATIKVNVNKNNKNNNNGDEVNLNNNNNNSSACYFQSQSPQNDVNNESLCYCCDPLPHKSSLTDSQQLISTAGRYNNNYSDYFPDVDDQTDDNSKYNNTNTNDDSRGKRNKKNKQSGAAAAAENGNVELLMGGDANKKGHRSIKDRVFGLVGFGKKKKNVTAFN